MVQSDDRMESDDVENGIIIVINFQWQGLHTLSRTKMMMHLHSLIFK